MGTKPLPISIERPTARPEELIGSSFIEDLLAAAKHTALSEDLALTILRRHDLQASILEAIARNHSVIKQRKVLAGGGRAPAHSTPHFIAAVAASIHI